MTAYPQEPLSIYIHIPFCRTRCSYCAFNIYTDLEDLIPAYVDALCTELHRAAVGNPYPSVHSIYFGGGTPSLLAPDRYGKILLALADAFSLARDVEVSLESNPNDLSTGYLRELKAVGINRLSIGMQSASPKILRLFDRRHDLASVQNAMRSAREAQFDNVNLDVIFGAPQETLNDWRNTVAALLGFAPDHISMYGLELKGGTALRQQVDAGVHPRPDDDLFAEMYEYASEKLEGAGFVQYEISNWRRPGYACRHNLQYWRNNPYLGIGAGAQGFAGGYRTSNIATPGKYIQALSGSSAAMLDFPLTPAVAKSKRVDRSDEIYETVMMGMRLTGEGIHRPTFAHRFGQDIAAMFPEALSKLQRLGLLEVLKDRIRLTPSGRLLSNAVIRELV